MRGYPGFLGRQHSIKTREQMSVSAKARGFSAQHRENIRIALIGRKLSEEHKYKLRLTLLGNQYRRGIPHSKEIREQMSKTRLGDGNGNWRGGTSKLPYAFEFTEELKERIRDRDNHICQKCGVPEAECVLKLAIHHIDYDKQNCLPSNLISLCKKCNSEVNSNRKYWQSFFEKRLEAR